MLKQSALLRYKQTSVSSRRQHILMKAVPSRNTVVGHPPVIDIACLVNPRLYSPEAIATVQQKICSACERWGFFHVTSHGIPTELQSELQHKMKEFFQSPLEIREAVRRTADNSRGWADDELTKQIRDCKQIFDVGGPPAFTDQPENSPENRVVDGFNQWPTLPGFQPTVSSYFEACTKLSRTLVSAIASSLGPGAHDLLATSFHNHSSFLRLNYYPLSEGVGSGQLGISRHTDSGALTIILQDSTAALEVWSGTKQDFGDGDWIPVDPVPGALTINTGDMLMVWSNGRFKAPEHRVRAMSVNERYSAPFFYNPDYSTAVSPILSGEGQHQDTPKYRSIVWGEFRRQRFAGDYADVGREIQIEDFLI